MNYRQARIFCICTTIIIVLLCINGIFCCSRPADNNEVGEIVTVSSEQMTEIDKSHQIINRTLKISSVVQNLRHQFSDLNDEHLAYAQKIGIKPIAETKDIMNSSIPIKEIMSCENYFVDKLSHSHPFLVYEAANLLDTIGAKFNTKLSIQNGGKYRLKVTSLLRTRESVKRLQRGNVNSTDNSAHLYGTTFDISYAKFYETPGNLIKHTDEQLKNLLAEVLIELRDEGKCLVKYEKKQGCFHITATGK